MKNQGVTQRELASQLGIKQTSLSYYFKKEDFRVKDLEKIVEYLQIDLFILFDENFEMSEPIVNYQKITGNNNNQTNNSNNDKKIKALEQQLEKLKTQYDLLKNELKSSQDIIKSQTDHITTLKNMIDLFQKN